MKRYIWIGVPILVIAAFLGWLFWASSKPLPGQKIADLGREHVPVGTNILGAKSDIDLPTSGPHYPDWIRGGVYESPKQDGFLVHSLEHGYVILSAKCNSPLGARSEKFEEATMSAEATDSADFDTEVQCKERLDQLAKIYEKKGKRKLIVVLRSNLDTNFALTAWTYLDKFNDFDGGRIEKFIDAHRDNGPERVVE